METTGCGASLATVQATSPFYGYFHVTNASTFTNCTVYSTPSKDIFVPTILLLPLQWT